MKKILLALIAILLSMNTMAQWQLCPQTDTCTINALYFSPAGLFAGTQGDGLWQSQDHGQNWTSLNNGLTNLSVNAITADTGGWLYAGVKSQMVFVSSDTGASWTGYNVNGTGNSITSLAHYQGYILAGENGDGVFRSLNRGSSWSEVGLCCAGVLSLCIDNSGKAWAGTNSGIASRASGSFGGWTSIDGGLPGQAIKALSANATYIFAGCNGGGVYRLPLAGSTWEACNNGFGNLHILALHSTGSLVIAGTDGDGTWYSNNNGGQWLPLNEAGSPQTIRSLTSDGTWLYAGTPSGVYRRLLSELTSVQEEPFGDFGLWPVPAVNILNLSNLPLGMNICIYTARGEKVIECSSERATLQLDVSQLPEGIFFIRFSQNSRVSVRPLIIVK